MQRKIQERNLSDLVKLMKKRIKTTERETAQLEQQLVDIQKKLFKTKETTFIAKMHLEEDAKKEFDALRLAQNVLHRKQNEI